MIPKPPDLERFVATRLPMVEHNLAEAATVGRPLSPREQQSKYCFKQAFFYPCEFWLPRRFAPLVSEGALGVWAKLNGGVPLWTLRRCELPKQLGQKLSAAPLHYEHVYTGEMCWKAMIRLRAGGNLNVANVTGVLLANYCTAWVARDESKQVNRSDRGEDLDAALAHFAERGVALVDGRTEQTPSAASAGAAGRTAGVSSPGPVARRLAVRIGLIVAAADGLSPRERDAVTAYARERSGLTDADVAEQQRLAGAGLAGVQAEEWRVLRGLGAENLEIVLADIRTQAAGDGELSATECALLSDVRRELEFE